MDQMDISFIGTTYGKWNKFSASAHLKKNLWWYVEHFLLKVKMEGKQNAQKYTEVLEKSLLTFLIKKNVFNHEFLIILPHTTKTTLQDITDQILGKMANIN